MIQQLITWGKAARLHTMGLSVAVIVVGSSQVGLGQLRWDVLLLALCSAVGFQLVSNFANDYGDFVKGSDAHRPEAYRALSAGNLTVRQVKLAIVLLSVFSVVAVIALVWRAPVSNVGKWVMFAMGLASVLAALAYTLGRHPYGYYALGDAMVFLFFGLVGVVGSYYLQGGAVLAGHVWCMALAFGGLSVTVLNINNMRDSDKDRAHGKITVANVLGERAMTYQAGLFITILLMFVLYAALTTWGLFALLAALLVVRVLWWSIKRAVSDGLHAGYNHCLALTVKMTLLLAIPTLFVGLSL